MHWIDFFLSGVCHQIPERSLTYEGQALPLCARCTGTFLGVIVGLLVLWLLRQGRRTGLPPWQSGVLLGALSAWWALDGLNSTWALVSGAAILYQPSNALRLITGMGNGLAISAVLYPVLNLALWSAGDARRVLERPAMLMALLLPGAALVALLWGWRAAPYALWAALAVGATVATLGVVNSVLLVLLTRKEGFAARWLALAPVLLGGLLMAALETGSLALLRRVLLGEGAGLL